MGEIAMAEPLVRFLETVAAVVAAKGAVAGGLDDHSRIIGHDGDGVAVEVGALLAVCPGFAAVGGAHHPAFLDRAEDHRRPGHHSSH